MVKQSLRFCHVINYRVIHRCITFWMAAQWGFYYMKNDPFSEKQDTSCLSHFVEAFLSQSWTIWQSVLVFQSPSSFCCLDISSQKVFKSKNRMEYNIVNYISWHDFTRKQECIPVGCVPSAAVAITVCPGGGSAQGGGVCPGESVYGGVHPPVDRMTDRCKNITLPQLRCER